MSSIYVRVELIELPASCIVAGCMLLLNIFIRPLLRRHCTDVYTLFGMHYSADAASLLLLLSQSLNRERERERHSVLQHISRFVHSAISSATNHSSAAVGLLCLSSSHLVSLAWQAVIRHRLYFCVFNEFQSSAEGWCKTVVDFVVHRLKLIVGDNFLLKLNNLHIVL